MCVSVPTWAQPSHGECALAQQSFFPNQNPVTAKNALKKNFPTSFIKIFEINTGLKTLSFMIYNVNTENNHKENAETDVFIGKITKSIQ